jgi:hypothetical protein
MKHQRESALFVLRAILCGTTFLLLSTTAWAGGRPSDDLRSWFGEFSGGWALAQSSASDNLKDDWTLSGGALFWPSDWPAGIKFDVSYANLDLSGSAISAINNEIAQDPGNAGRIDGGDVTTWGLTINGIWGPGNRSTGLYLTAGAGYYYMKGQLTSTGLVYYPPVCDPWYWWWCVPGGIGPGTIVEGSKSTNRFGYNAGLGFSIDTGGGQLFLEAKYFIIDAPSRQLRFVPLTVGFRW